MHSSIEASPDVPHISPPVSAGTGAPVLRAELAWVAAAVFAGAWLRVAVPGRMAVEHFDEAVYASNVLYGPEAGYQFPGREFFAPPFLPTVIEWLHIAWGSAGGPVPGWLPMLPALLCGAACIPSVWWIARRWFSAEAGIAAAWLLGLCEFHMAYSRAALTDVPLTFFLLWAVYWSRRALDTNSKWLAGLAGAFTAAAWWTKYNGWLPIAVAIAATGMWLLLSRASRRTWLRKGAVCAIAASTAVILWSPVLWDCEEVGGYAAIAANHRGYVTGWSAWLANARQQLEVHGGAYAGWLTALGICGPTICCGLMQIGFTRRLFGDQHAAGDDQRPFDWQRYGWLAFNGGVVAVHPASWFPLIVGAGVVCSALALRRALRDQSEALGLNAAFALTWVLGLLVATPLYRPYPRLTLPLVVGSLLAGSIFWRRGWAPFTAPGRTWWLGPALMLAAAGLVGGVRGSIAWEDRTYYQAAAVELSLALARLEPNRSAVVFASGEPALTYWLQQSGVPAANAASLEIAAYPGVSTWLAIGPVTRTTPDFAARWAKFSADFDQIATVRPQTLRLSSLVRFDQDPPVQQQLQSDPLTVELWRRR